THDTEDDNPRNVWSTPCHLSGSKGTSSMDQDFCMKTIDRADIDDRRWPAGQYCIYRKGGICPAGMTGGTVYWDDENDSNRNSASGVLPDGYFNSNTRIYFCCQTSGYANNPIYLPTENNFMLFKYNSQCQQVHGMQATSEFFTWDTEDSNNADSVTGNHPYKGIAGSGITLYLCYYERI
ncbi:uncharacterized protein, partial [Amphiura filiformis]|uniref:uncharacterized protein n=1 Tax=Amphiura filiformis TaxID=82378 RepID=UPI003B215CB0